MRQGLSRGLATIALLALHACTAEVVEPVRPRVTASASTSVPAPPADSARWFQLPEENGVSAALKGGGRWLLVGGRRAVAKEDGSITFASADPAGLRQLVFLVDGGEAFYGIAGSSLVRFAGPLGKAETLFEDARLVGARAQPFAARILVRPASGDPFLVGGDGRNETPLASALPFEASAVSMPSASAGFVMTDAFGLLSSSDGGRTWLRAPPLLEGELATRQGASVERVRSSGKTVALAGAPLATFENKTAALIDEQGRDPLALVAAGGAPLESGDFVVAVPLMEPGSSVAVTLFRVSGTSGEVLSRKPLGRYPLRPFAPGVNEPRCNLGRAPRNRLLVECDGFQLFELDANLEVTGARSFETKLRLSEAGGALAEGECQGSGRAGFACVRNPDGSFQTVGFARNPSAGATLMLPKPDGSLVVVDYESQSFDVRAIDRAGSGAPVTKFGSRVRAAKIHGDLDGDGALTLVVEGTPGTAGELPSVEVSTVVDGRVKTDSFPGAITARNVGNRVVLRSASEIIARDTARGAWQRFPRDGRARGDVRVSAAGFIAGDDVRIGWPLTGAPVAKGAPAATSGSRELVCKLERNLRNLPRLDNSAIDSTVPEWTRTSGGRVAIAREASRYRIRYFSRTPIDTIEEFYVPARSIAPITIAGTVVRGSDLGLLINTGKQSWAIRRVNGSAAIETIATPSATQAEMSIGADGSLAWDRGRPGARQIVLWPKTGTPRDALVTDRNNFRYEPFDKGIDVRSLGTSTTAVARYPLSELATPLSIEPARFKADGSLALSRLLAAPPCRSNVPSEARVLDLEKAYGVVVVDNERLAATRFDLGFARAGGEVCMAAANVTTERSSWQVGVEMGTGTALVTKTPYQRLPASCVLQAIDKSSP